MKKRAGPSCLLRSLLGAPKHEIMDGPAGSCVVDGVAPDLGPGDRQADPEPPPPIVGYLPVFGKISAKCCSFSAVSAPIFAKKKHAFCSIFQNLPDYLAENFEISNLAIFCRFCDICKTVAEFSIFTKNADISNRFFAKFLRLQRCKRMQLL